MSIFILYCIVLVQYRDYSLYIGVQLGQNGR